MAEPILCLVILLVVMWVLLLLSENRGLKDDVKSLKRRLSESLERESGRLQIGEGRRLTASEIRHASKPALRQR